MRVRPPLREGVVALSLALTAGLGADPFADAVLEFSPGGAVTFGQGFFPDNVLGPPEGGPSDSVPQNQEQHLLSLGHGGSITLAFTDNVLLDGPGVDLLVFENALINAVNGDPFVEVATVEFSQNGVTWLQIPFDYESPDPPDPPTAPPVITEANFPFGFAGLTPTRSNTSNGVDPTDPAVAGGDGFDLAGVGLSWAQFVRLTDSGLRGTATERTDADGDVIADDGDFDPLNMGPSTGFDLDAVAAVHTEGVTATPRALWDLYR
jgi:hypothetical protein